MRHLPTLFVFTIAGGVAGGAVAVLLALLTASHPRPEKVALPPEEASPRVEALPGAAPPSAELQALARELADLRARVSANEKDGAASAAPSAPAQVTEEEHELQVQKTVATFHTALAQHDRDAVDPSLAPRASRVLKKDFERLAANGNFDVKSVDCRTTTCVADVDFKDKQAAVTHWKSLLNAHLDVNCGIQMVLDAQVHGDDPYPTRVLMDCEEARAEATN